MSKIIKEAIEVSIGGNAYMHNRVNQWTSNVVEACLGNLTKLQKAYKYIGNYYFGLIIRSILKNFAFIRAFNN